MCDCLDELRLHLRLVDFGGHGRSTHPTSWMRRKKAIGCCEGAIIARLQDKRAVKNQGRPKFRLYPGDHLCPCGSGRTYRECCKQKKFRFEIDERGNVRKRLKISSRLTPVLEEAAQEFKKMFGRHPGGRDPVVFNHWLNGEDDFWQHSRAIYRSAGIPEELSFAHRRSGFVVGEHSRELMPDSEHREWEDAIEEYFLLKEAGHDPFFVFTYLSGDEYEKYKSLVSLLDTTIIVLGFSFTDPKPFVTSGSYLRYLLLYRSIRSLRTVREMYNTRYDDDCLAIARAVYEAYLRMKLLRRDPKSCKRFEAMVAHAAGTFPTKLKKNGQPNYGVCIDPATGQEFDLIISNGEIIDISDFPLDAPLYYDLYPLLSGHVHPELVRDLLNSAGGTEANSPHQNDSIRAIIVVLTICFLLLSEVAESSFVRARTKRDLRYVIKQLHRGLADFITTETIIERKNVPQSIYVLFGARP